VKLATAMREHIPRGMKTTSEQDLLVTAAWLEPSEQVNCVDLAKSTDSHADPFETVVTLRLSGQPYTTHTPHTVACSRRFVARKRLQYDIAGSITDDPES